MIKLSIKKIKNYLFTLLKPKKFIPLIILVISLLFTGLWWYYIRQNIINEQQLDFDIKVRNSHESIQQRMIAYEQVLRGLQGIFSLSYNVKREDFTLYYNKLNLGKNYPGFQSLEFTKIILPENKISHINEIRKEGFSEYKIKPEGERKIFTTILYIEPFRDINLRAFGFDMYSEPLRRAAMEKSRDTSNTSISAKVQLIQETTNFAQAGFIMYLPVYKNKNITNEIEDRRKNIIGWVSAHFRMNDLMSGIFGELSNDIDVEIYDDDKMSLESLMFKSQNEVFNKKKSYFKNVKQILIIDHIWTVAIYSMPVFDKQISNNNSRIFIFIGIILSFLLTLITWMMATGRERIRREAVRMNYELIESQERFKLLLDSTAEAIYGLDMKGNCTFCNTVCLKLLGYNDRKELIGENMHDKIHYKNPDGSILAKENCKIYKAFQNGKGVHVTDEVFWRKDGTNFPVEYFSYPQKQNDEIVGAVITFFDITEKINMANEIEYKDKLLISIAGSTNKLLSTPLLNEALPLCLKEIGKSLNIDRIFVYKKTFEQNENFYFTLIDEWINGDDNEMKNEIEKNIEITLERNPEFYEIRYNKKIYKSLYSDLNFTMRKTIEKLSIKSIMVIPIVQGEGFLGFIGFIDSKKERIWSDTEENILVSFALSISSAMEREKSENELKEAKVLAESANEAKTNFLANISHELRTPLNSIIGISKMIWKKNSDNLTDRQKEGLSLVYDSGTKLLSLINDILDIAKIESGKMGCEYEPVNLIEILNKQINILKTSIDNRHIDTRLLISKKIPELIMLDRLKIEQILSNILSNAAKFTDKGSISIYADWNDNLLTIVIEDTGIGISSNEIEKVFEKFYQTDQSMSRRYKGTGLGLPLVREMLRIMGGTIKLESDIGKGTKVIISIKTEVYKDKQDELQKNDVNELKSKKIILIAEDEFLNRSAFKIMLEDQYEIHFAENGIILLEMIPYVNPDIILMDIMMPEMDGLETIRKIKMIPELVKIPIIAVTARAMPEEKENILNAGFDSYITKPVDVQILIQNIESLLEEKND